MVYRSCIPTYNDIMWSFKFFIYYYSSIVRKIIRSIRLNCGLKCSMYTVHGSANDISVFFSGKKGEQGGEKKSSSDGTERDTVLYN